MNEKREDGREKGLCGSYGSVEARGGSRSDGRGRGGGYVVAGAKGLVRFKCMAAIETYRRTK